LRLFLLESVWNAGKFILVAYISDEEG
jgi:hypothetical protein